MSPDKRIHANPFKFSLILDEDSTFENFIFKIKGEDEEEEETKSLLISKVKKS